MPAAYEPIATTVLGSDTSTVDFTGISQSFIDLVLVANIANNQTSTTAAVIRLQVGNGSIDTGSNYSTTFIFGETSGTSTRVTNQTFGYNGECLGTLAKRSTLIIQLQNYSNTTTNKSFLTRHGTGSRIEANASLWRSTSAINQVRIFLSGNSFITGSTFTLYGIRSA